MNVNRYDSSTIMWALDGAPLTPTSNGQWVSYDDYAALAAENERNRAGFEFHASLAEKKHAALIASEAEATDLRRED